MAIAPETQARIKYSISLLRSSRLQQVTQIWNCRLKHRHSKVEKAQLSKDSCEIGDADEKILTGERGVQSVIADLQAQRVVVTGFVDPIKVLKKAKRVKRDSMLYTGTTSGYGGAEYLPSVSKYRRSEYRPSLYRTSSYELRRPSVYRTSSLEYRPSVYRTSYNQYTPSYGQSYVHRPLVGSNYIDGYSPVVTNPHYFKHVESEYY